MQPGHREREKKRCSDISTGNFCFRQAIFVLVWPTPIVDTGLQPAACVNKSFHTGGLLVPYGFVFVFVFVQVPSSRTPGPTRWRFFVDFIGPRRLRAVRLQHLLPRLLVGGRGGEGRTCEHRDGAPQDPNSKSN